MWKKILVGVLVKFAYIYPLIHVLLFVPIQWGRVDGHRDTVAYHQASVRVAGGTSPYVPLPPGPHRDVGEFQYLYPPYLAAALGLAPQTSFVTFARAWLVLLLAAFWGYAVCLAKLAEGRVTLRGTLVAGAILSFTPGGAMAITLGQADALMWPLIGAGLGWSSARGAGFLGAALLKVHGAWPLVLAAWRERRPVVVSAAAAAAVALAVGLVAFGPKPFVDAHRDWLVHVVPALGQGEFFPGNGLFDAVAHVSSTLPVGGSVVLPVLLVPNLSLSFAPIELAHRMGWWTYPGGDLPAALRGYLLAVGVLAPLLTAWWTRRRPPVVQYALVVSAAILFAPIFRPSNIPLLLAPVAALLGEARTTRAER